jgi:hypothetical protein
LSGNYIKFRTGSVQEPAPKLTATVIKADTIEAHVKEIVVKIIKEGLNFLEIQKLAGQAKDERERLIWRAALDDIRKQYPALLKGQNAQNSKNGGRF